MKAENVVERVKDEGVASAREVAFSPAVETLTRVGFGARGLLYFLMGLIALLVALGKRGATADQQGVLAAIGAQPAGRILLIIMLVGLVGYALWGLIRFILDPLHEARGKGGIWVRIGFLASAISYGSLVFPTYGLLGGGNKPAQNGAQTAQAQGLASKLLASQWGPWVLGAVGVLFVVIGIGQISKAISRKFDKQFQMYELNAGQAHWIKRLGRFGTAARGVVFGITGLFLFIAALRLDPSKAQGIDGALMKLMQLPYGPYLLAVVALGLMAFGVYSMTGGLWFRFKKGYIRK